MVENDRYRAVSDFAGEVAGLVPGPVSVLRAFAAGDKVGQGEMIMAGYGDSRFDTSEHGPVLSHFASRFMEEHVAAHPDKPFMVYYATPAIHVPLTPDAESRGSTGLGVPADFAADLAGPWTPGALFTGADTWTLTRPLAGPRCFFRTAGPACIERPALPPT